VTLNYTEFGIKPMHILLAFNY